jgi:competence protein ComEA
MIAWNGKRLSPIWIVTVLMLLLAAANTWLDESRPMAGEWPEHSAELRQLFAEADRKATTEGDPSEAAQAARGEHDEESGKAETAQTETEEAAGSEVDIHRSGTDTVPMAGSKPDSDNGGTRMEADAGGGNLLDINQADAGRLTELPGIGPSKANAIVEYRKANGPFRSLEDLKKVKGIGEKTFQSIKHLITIGNVG